MLEKAPFWKVVLATVLIYSGVVVTFTVMSLLLATPAEAVGGVRAIDTIPTHLAELAGFGAILGVGSWMVYGSKGGWLVVLSPILVVSLDLDHLPVYLGVPQVIRPAHSIIFILAALVVVGTILRRMEIELILVSSFMGHMGVDSGIFPAFAPLSFQYFPLQPVKVPLLIGAVVFALAAGFVFRASKRGAG